MADTANSTIRKVTPAGVVTTLAGSAGTRAARMARQRGAVFQPFGVAVDSAGELYVADFANYRITKGTPVGQRLVPVATLDRSRSHQLRDCAGRQPVERDGQRARGLQLQPSAGTVPGAGTNGLAVVFNPTDTADYTSVTGNVSLVVLRAPLSVTANSATRAFGATNPAFTGTIAGLQNADNITATYTCSATPGSPPGTYPIVASLNDPGSRLGNYTVTTNNGTLTVTCAAITVSPATLPSGTNGVAYNQTLTASGGASPYGFHEYGRSAAGGPHPVG